MPFPVRPIPSNRIRHIQHHVQRSRRKTTALIVLLRIIRRSHPFHTVIRDQSILPLHTPSDGKLRCKPLTQRPVQSERHTLRNHLREVTPIRIHQTHIRSHLHEPVIPHPIRPHSRLFTFHFSFFTSIGGSQIYLGAYTDRQVAIRITSRSSPSTLIRPYKSTTRHDIRDIPYQTPSITQSIRIEQTNTSQQRTLRNAEVIIHANPWIETQIPSPITPIRPKQIMHIHEQIPIQPNIATLLSIHTRLVKWRQPVRMIILQQRQRILPIKLPAHTNLRCNPLTYRHIHTERLTIGEHLREVIPIRILQTHIQVHLHKPVMPEPSGPHRVKVPLLKGIHHLKCLTNSTTPKAKAHRPRHQQSSHVQILYTLKGSLPFLDVTKKTPQIN